MSQAVAPLIPSSTVNYAQEDRVLRCSTLETNLLTDYVATLQNGQLTNLIYPPINPQDAATVEYVNNTTYAGGISGSIQYNNNSVFGGSPNLTFDGNSLTINGTFTDGIFSMAGNYINNLVNPVNQLDIATKNYVDDFSKVLKETTLKSDTSVVYAAQYMVNGIILRNSSTLSNITLEDFTDTASNIIQKYPGVVNGSVVRFILQNSNISNVSISLKPGFGLTFVGATKNIIPNILIRPNYTLYARLIVTNKTYGIQAVTLNIDSISWTMAYMSPFFVRSQEPAATNYTTVAATTTDITLAGFQTVDSYVTQANDIILVKDQTSSTENGIYIVSAGSWSRSSSLASGSNAFNIDVYVTGPTFNSVSSSSGLVTFSDHGAYNIIETILTDSTAGVNNGLVFNSEPYVNPLIVGSYGLNFSTNIQTTISSFTTSLPYAVSNIFLEPVIPDTVNTTVNYQYNASDIKTGLVIRNPSGPSGDSFENFLETNTLFQASSFMIQNISSYTITLISSPNWVYISGNTGSISIGPTTSSLFWINMTSSTQTLNSIGLFPLN